MTIEMNCSNCEGRLTFAARRVRVSRRVGSCDTCGSVFTLEGGRVVPIDTAGAFEATQGG